MGTWLARVGSHEEAIEFLQQSIQLQPGEPSTLCALGTSYAELRRYDEAIRELQQCASKDAGWPDTHFQLGWCFSETGQPEKAVDAYLRTLQLQPHDVFTHFNLGVAYRDLGRINDEIEEYKKTLEIAPDHREALINLAIAYSRSGHGEWAIETWKQVISCKPDSLDGYGSLLMAYESLGRYQEALEVSREIERRSSNARAMTDVAVFLNGLKKFDDALKKAREAIRSDPTLLDAYLHAGWALMGLGDYQSAIGDYLKALELKSDCPYALVNLGHCYVALEQNNEAIALLKHAIDLHPESVSAHDALGLAYFKIGNREKAISELGIV